MRKVLTIVSLLFLSVVLVTGTAFGVAGQCANCHTMHASQNGTLMGDGPHNYLLLYSCLGCHSGPAGGATTSNGAPIVLRTSGTPAGTGAGMSLAGGDFYWVDQGSDARGHNVDVVAAQDVAIGANIGNNPPGWDNAQTDGAAHSIALGAVNWASQLTCAGSYGCHGDHSVSGNDAGIKGSHHGNTGGTSAQITAPTTMGGSYRFLDRIKGKEDATWNWGETTANHNEYAGSTYNDGGASDKGTISFSCAECHGDFHTTADVGGTTTPWLRHPTDIVLYSVNRGTTEYSMYNGGNGTLSTYSLVAPVARGTVPASSSSNVYVAQTDDDGAIVMCLSCHRAHGSEYADILRWDYATIQAGQGGGNIGCFICHTTKD